MVCKVAVLIAALCAFLFAQQATADRGFLLTSPRSLDVNAANIMQLHLYEVEAEGVVKVQLFTTDDGNDTFVSENESRIPANVKRAEIVLLVPPVDAYGGKIKVSGSFQTPDNYSIYGEEKVSLRPSASRLTFIQTDKPLYKPSQEVKFRVLLVDKALRLLGDDIESDIWVDDPKGSRLAQWKGVQLGKGIKQLAFPLSDEPNLGNWKILVSIKNDIQSTTFEVKEYVLPKFEVTITPPSFVLATAETITLKICAKYTYGKNVEGTLKLNASLENYSWSREKLPTVEFEEQLQGCYKYDLNVSLVDKENYYSYRRVQIDVSVIEKGTGIVRNETKYIDRTLSPLNLNFQEDQRQYFKPGLPYNGKLKVTNPDNSPAKGEEIEVCYTTSRERVLSDWWATRKMKHCRNLTSDEEGIIDYILKPQNTDAVSVFIEAKSIRFSQEVSVPGKPFLSRPQTSTSLKPWFSPSGSHMQVQPASKPLKCGEKASIQLLYTSKEDADYRFNYEIISRGAVVASRTIDATFTTDQDVSQRFKDETRLVEGVDFQIVPPPQSPEKSSETVEEECPSAKEARYVPPIGQENIEIDVTAAMSPSFHLLVYYIRDDRETVADSQKFTVEKCFQNNVVFKFGDEVKQPGAKTSINLNASPNSVCGIKVVDKSISLMDSSDQLTKDEVFNALQRSDSGVYYSINHCNEAVRQPGLMQKSYAPGYIMPPRPWSSSPYEDALTAFEISGYLVISDLVLMTRPCKNSGNSYESYGGGGYGGGTTTFADVGVRGGAQVRPMAFAATRQPAPQAESNNKMGVSATKSVVDVRNFFPETWLFNMETIGEDGQFVSKAVLPHTITEWLGSAVCVDSTDGLGISEVSSIRGFQEFFVSFTLPYSVIRGEKFWITVSLFNYIEGALPITVTLEQADGYVITGDGIDGDICVKGGKSETLRLQVQATSLGTLNFTVSARTADSKDICGDTQVSNAVAKDAVKNTLLVEAEGFPQEQVDSILFCPKEEKDGIFSKDIQVTEKDIVPDSGRAFFLVTGNILGPAIDNLDRLVVLPTGCGEQNMVLFTPNVFVLEYLTSIGKLTDKIRNKATNNLIKGAQRQMKYRHEDGSFSAFGVSDKHGSMFLSAFVLRSFSQAKKYIAIDNERLNQTLNWITSKQLANGCFPEVGRTVDSQLKGGVGSPQASPAIITAYVTTSLLISGYQNKTAIDAALSCVENDTTVTPYKAALYAYTYALAGNVDKAKEYIETLNQRANKTGDSVSFHTVNGSESLDVETAAYAVLANLKTGGGLLEALPIVRWMSKNRNSRGGFISTQDTVLGLEALSAFSTLIGKDPLDLNVKASGDLNQEIQISEDDKILVREYKIGEVPAKLDLEATGKGCGLMQIVHRYNTLTPPQKKTFNLDVQSKCSDDGCKHATIKVCTSYVPEGKKTNMAIVDVKMVSGMSPVKDSLEKISRNRKTGLMRYDVENNHVILYFNELSNDVTCFDFGVEELAEIEDRKSATAKVYDYYAPENEATTKYSVCSSNCPEEATEQEK